MKPLSERLEDAATESVVVEMGFDYTISKFRHDEQTQALLREAAALAKRYEEAPVAEVCWECQHTGLPHIDPSTIDDERAVIKMHGETARLVREPAKRGG